MACDNFKGEVPGTYTQNIPGLCTWCGYHYRFHLNEWRDGSEEEETEN
jgi:hypothetical protein